MIRPRVSKVIVVGGGIAGYSVLWHLRKAQVHGILFDLPGRNTSSRKAAGLINPFIIKRYTLSWNAAETFEKARDFYHDLQTSTGIQCMNMLPVFRWLPHQGMIDEWIRIRNTQAHLAEYMGLPEPVPATSALRYGWRATVPQSFRVHVENLFQALEKHFRAHIRIDTFNYQALKPFGRQWVYEDEAWDGVVFCDGTSVLSNPFFRHPFLRPCKGQWLVTRNPGLDAGYLGPLFLLPDPEERLLVGSTYEHNYAHEDPDEMGRMKLIEGFRKMTGREPEVLRHVAGIRPVSADRRPVAGPHPDFPGLFILNGLGSRGFLLAPYWAERLVKHILQEECLPPEVVYNRYLKKISSARNAPPH